MVINYYWQTTLQMYVFTSFQTLVMSTLNQTTYQKPVNQNLHMLYVLMYTRTKHHMKHICSVKTSIISVQKILFYLLCLPPLSAISWRPVLVVEEARVPGENHRPWASNGKVYHLRLRVECTLFVIYKAGREPTPYWR